MANIVLLSCSKSKLDYAAPAQELYSASPMFKKTLEYGKSLKPDKMYILSAKHHLVPLNKKLAPYDKTLKEMPADEKEVWGKDVAKQMTLSGVDLKNDNFIFLTGNEYLKPLLKYIPSDHISKPMEGKRFGQRLSWLNSQIQNIKEVVLKIKNILNEIFKK